MPDRSAIRLCLQHAGPGGLIENEVVHVFGGRHDGRSSPIQPRSVSGSGCATAISWPTCARGRTLIRYGSGSTSKSTVTCWGSGSAKAGRCNHDAGSHLRRQGPQYRALLERRFQPSDFISGTTLKTPTTSLPTST